MPNLKQKNSYLNHLLRNQLTSLILYERISTTLSKAKKLKPLAQRVLNSAQKNDLTSRRRLARLLFDSKAVSKVFDQYVPKMRSNQNWIKIYRLGKRLGDNTTKAIICLSPALRTINNLLPEKPTDGQPDGLNNNVKKTKN